MKLVKNFVLSVLFVSALAVNTFAGQLDTPGYVPPPPPQSSSTSSTVVTDENTSSVDESGETAEVSDELLFDAFMAVLALF